jgi:hypothetical protein
MWEAKDFNEYMTVLIDSTFVSWGEIKNSLNKNNNVCINVKIIKTIYWKLSSFDNQTVFRISTLQWNAFTFLSLLGIIHTVGTGSPPCLQLSSRCEVSHWFCGPYVLPPGTYVHNQIL